MSYIEKSRQNKVNAEKAASFDRMQQTRREEDLYAQGSNDAYSAVERELMRKAEVDRQMDRDMAAGAAYYQANKGADNANFRQMLGDVGSIISNKVNAAGEYISDAAKGLGNTLYEGVKSGFVPTPEESARNKALGAAMKADMVEEATNRAFSIAQEQGDTSEENLNRLITEQQKLMGVEY